MLEQYFALLNHGNGDADGWAAHVAVPAARALPADFAVDDLAGEWGRALVAEPRLEVIAGPVGHWHSRYAVERNDAPSMTVSR